MTASLTAQGKSVTGSNWAIPVPVLLFLIGYGVGAVWWGGGMNSRLANLEQVSVTREQMREVQTQITGLRRDVTDNIVVRRRNGDRIVHLEQMTAIVDERTRGMNVTIKRIHDQLVKASEIEP